MIKKNTKQEGFTLVELLVVIAIIGLLSTLSIVALNNARLRSRDAARVADVKQWQTALELYYSDAGYYPSSSLPDILKIEPGGSLVSGVGTMYMSQIPSSPKPWGDSTCATAGDGGIAQDFFYTRQNASTYTIWYCLGSATGGLKAGVGCATPAGISDGAGCIKVHP